MSFDVFARQGLTLLLDASLKSLLILAGVGLVLLLGRRASAAARHLVALLGLAGFLGLPLLTQALPHWPVPIWRQAMTAVPPVPAVVAPLDNAPEPSGAGVPNASFPLTSPPVLVAPVPPAVVPSAPVRPPFPWPAWLFGGWLLGVCAASLPTLAGLFAVVRLTRRCRRIEGGPVAALGRELWQGRPVALLCGDAGDLSVVPMTWGWLRPTVLLPAGVEGWPPDRLRVVLLHELAHIRRGDWPCQMLAHVVCALYWFHPGAWLLARQLRSESERACDDLVLAAGVPPDAYARHLLEVIRSMKVTQNTLRVVLPMAQPSQIEGRLRTVLAPRRNRTVLPRPVRVLACAALLGLTAVLASIRPAAQAQGQPTAPVPEQSARQVTVVVDAGHGGRDTGAVAADGTREKDLTLAVAQTLRETLIRRGAGVAMTRTTDAYLPLVARSQFANAQQPRILVSLHCDIAAKPNSHTGTTVFYHGQNAAGRRLASDVLTGLSRSAGLAPFQIKSDTTRFPMGFAILRASRVPAVLVECGFMNNAQDVTALRTAPMQQRVAEGITSGIRVFLASPVPSAVVTPTQATARLKQIYTFVQIYRSNHAGAYPATMSSSGDLMGSLSAHPLDYGLPDLGAANGSQATGLFTLPDPARAGQPPVIRIFMHGKRPDGTQVGAARRPGTRDVLAYTNVFVENKKFPKGWRIVGFYLVLWDSGAVTRVPANKMREVPTYDIIGATPQGNDRHSPPALQLAFPGQAGLPVKEVRTP